MMPFKLLFTTLFLFSNVAIAAKSGVPTCTFGIGGSQNDLHVAVLLKCELSTNEKLISINFKSEHKGLEVFLFNTQNSIFFRHGKSPILGPLLRKIEAIFAGDPNELERDLYEIDEDEVKKMIPDYDCWLRNPDTPEDCGSITPLSPQSAPVEWSMIQESLRDPNTIPRDLSYRMGTERYQEIFRRRTLHPTQRAHEAVAASPNIAAEARVILNRKARTRYLLHFIRKKLRQEAQLDPNLTEPEFIP